jgi:teichuronic acid biosynthesis glycosyltransferase TuaH
VTTPDAIADAVANDDDWSAIIVAAVPYDGSMPLSCWQLARVMGRRRPVLYVEPPHSAAHGVRFGLQLRKASDGSKVHVLTPSAPPAYDRPGAASIADFMIARQVSKAADECLVGRRALLACTPRRGLLQVPADVLVYWQRDAIELLSRRGRAAWLGRRHRKLLEAADVVTGVSPELVERATAVGRTAVLVPNGCDYDHFSTPQPRPRELPTDRVIVGFSGGVSDRIDAALLISLVDARPEWLFVAVGEVARPLPARDNLLVIGWRPYREMPGWLQAFDVGVIPYQEDTSNLQSNPLKALEYLAAGTPVVSVPIQALGGLGDVVRLASGEPKFLEALDDMVAMPPTADRCRAVAAGQSWMARVDVLEALVQAKLRGDPEGLPSTG